MMIGSQKTLTENTTNQIKANRIVELDFINKRTERKRTMKKMTFIMWGTLLAMLCTSAVAVDEVVYRLHTSGKVRFYQWGSALNDPMTNGQWEVKVGRISTLDTWSDYEDAIYDPAVDQNDGTAGGGRWTGWTTGTAQSQAADQYDLWPQLLTKGSAYPASNLRTIIAAVFTAPIAGTYQLQGTDGTTATAVTRGYQRASWSDDQNDFYYKVALNGTMTLLYTWNHATSGSSWCRPQDIPELQTIRLLAGERIVIAISNATPEGTWWNAVLYTGDTRYNTAHGFLQAVWLPPKGTTVIVK